MNGSSRKLRKVTEQVSLDLWYWYGFRMWRYWMQLELFMLLWKECQVTVHPMCQAVRIEAIVVSRSSRKL